MPKISGLNYVSQLEADGYMLGIQGGEAVRFPVGLFDGGSATVTGTFLGNDDTPDSYTGQAGKLVAVNETEDGLEFSDPPAQDFLGLTDTPDAYTGQGSKLVAVTSGATGLEFVEVPSSITDSATAPSSPENGDLWMDSASTVPVQFIQGGTSGSLISEKTLASDATYIEFTGLNSLEDGDYTLEYCLKSTSGSSGQALMLQVNGYTSSSQYMNRVICFNTGANYYAADSFGGPSGLWIGSIGVVNCFTIGDVALRVRGGTVTAKASACYHWSSPLSSNNSEYALGFGELLETITSISSIKILPSGSNYFATGSVFRLYGSNSASKLISYSPFSLASFSGGRLLKAGEVAYLDYSNATSVPLNVQTEEGVYELYIIGDKTGSASTGDVNLLPNNSTTSSIIGRYNSNGSQYQTTSLTTFPLGAGKVYSITAIVTTGNTTRNTVKTSAIGDDNSTVRYFEGMFWQSSLVWTSLGTVTFPFAQTGKIVIRRII